MKPIPKELQAYFPKAPDPARPWWSMAPFPNGVSSCPEWQRGEAPPRPLLEAGRVDIDKTNPLPPPPILVGQVWAIPTTAPGSFFIASVVAVELYADGRRGLHWSGYAPSHPMLDTYTQGFLLSCPYGYAPWSGVEVVP